MVPVIDTDNRRHARRFRAHHPAQILLGSDAMIPCTVKDISTGGARLALKPQMDLPETFEIFIAAHDLQVRRARVCWRKGDFAGIAFSEEDDAIAAVEAPRMVTFADCLDQAAAMPAHLAAKPARKNLKLWQTSI
ncbi:PilZ domain-containing protein [Microvirga sp. BT689]|uniref:PilZ domain-containing protein n=1 Tax=Microvirga arvi TaxID=2778731 RepID=UPI0019511D6D|nr:PilZ domain-containing protein [Microvirga arvi]MBM6579018.1 PilZ domain-containing protein [Microvirga arvi]